MQILRLLPILTLLSYIPTVSGFVPQNVAKDTDFSVLQASRRNVIETLSFVPAAMMLSVSVEPADASGGATAGGAYLLSAKQRYNERVKQGVKGLLAAESALKSGDANSAKAFFSTEDPGSWKDLTAAGYLLSNAFRRSSTQPPDRYVYQAVQCLSTNDLPRVSIERHFWH